MFFMRAHNLILAPARQIASLNYFLPICSWKFECTIFCSCWNCIDFECIMFCPTFCRCSLSSQWWWLKPSPCKPFSCQPRKHSLKIGDNPFQRSQIYVSLEFQGNIDLRSLKWVIANFKGMLTGLAAKRLAGRGFEPPPLWTQRTSAKSRTKHYTLKVYTVSTGAEYCTFKLSGANRKKIIKRGNLSCRSQD